MRIQLLLRLAIARLGHIAHTVPIIFELDETHAALTSRAAASAAKATPA